MEEEKYLLMADWIGRYLKGEIDNKIFEDWVNESEENQALFEKLNKDNKWLSKELSSTSHMNDQLKTQAAWKKMKEKIHSSVLHPQSKPSIKKNMLRYAAAILFLFFTSSLLFYKFYSVTHKKLPISSNKAKESQSGIHLYTTDHQVIDLLKDKNFEKREGKGTLIRNKANILNYQAMELNSHEMLYNRITVSYGHEYTIRLSDSSLVFLNAGSSIKFPVSFIGNNREVEINGEAYFEISASKKPFVVHTVYGSITVLGTNFNVKCFTEDQLMETTLVNGAVQVAINKQAPVLLKPNQQAIYSPKSDLIQVENVDAYLYTSWKNGQIIFKDRTLDYIMSTLSRWYNFEVIWDDITLKNERFGCKLNKFSTVDPIFDLLASTKKVKFKKIKNKIHISG